MRKGLPILILVGATLLGMAGAASAQDYQHNYRPRNSEATVTRQHHARSYYRTQENAAVRSNEALPGRGRVNSDNQY